MFLWWSLGNFRGFGEGDPEKARREKMLGMILGFEGDVRVISPKAKKVFGVFFGYWGDFPGASPKATLKPRLQISAGADKSTDTREIIHRYCKLGIARSILRCADAIAITSCTDIQH